MTLFADGWSASAGSRMTSASGRHSSPWAMGAFCLLAASLMLHDLPNFWRQDIYPVCEFDLVRYGGTVREVALASGAVWIMEG